MVRIVDAASDTVICQVATNKVSGFHKIQIWQGGDERDLTQIEQDGKVGMTAVAEMADYEDYVSDEEDKNEDDD